MYALAYAAEKLIAQGEGCHLAPDSDGFMSSHLRDALLDTDFHGLSNHIRFTSYGAINPDSKGNYFAWDETNPRGPLVFEEFCTVDYADPPEVTLTAPVVWHDNTTNLPLLITQTCSHIPSVSWAYKEAECDFDGDFSIGDVCYLPCSEGFRSISSNPKVECIGMDQWSDVDAPCYPTENVYPSAVETWVVVLFGTLAACVLGVCLFVLCAKKKQLENLAHSSKSVSVRATCAAALIYSMNLLLRSLGQTVVFSNAGFIHICQANIVLNYTGFTLFFCSLFLSAKHAIDIFNNASLRQVQNRTNVFLLAFIGLDLFICLSWFIISPVTASGLEILLETSEDTLYIHTVRAICSVS